MTDRITAELKEGLNRAEYEPDTWSTICVNYGNCGLNGSTINTFCDDWNKYVAKRTFADQINDGFNTRFGTSCSVPKMTTVSQPNFYFSTTVSPTTDRSGSQTLAEVSSSNTSIVSQTVSSTCDSGSSCSGKNCTKPLVFIPMG